MSSPRLETALNAGSLEWPPGRVLALRPVPGQSGLPADDTLVVHGFRPAFEAWKEAGFEVAIDVAEGDFAAAFVSLPRSKEQAKHQISCAAKAVSAGGLIVVDGAKTDGVESIAKLLRGAFGPLETLSKAHGKLIWFKRPPHLQENVQSWSTWTDAPIGWHTAPGVFSATKIDAGSQLLVENLPKVSGRGVDLGAGWGYLSAKVLSASNTVTHIDLVEAEWVALNCAKRNLTDPRAAFHWSDVVSFQAEKYDFVLTNPPFHLSRKSEPALGRAFLSTAARLLKPTGTLALVANRHLPYEAILSESFKSLETRADKAGFKVIHAKNPRPSTGH